MFFKLTPQGGTKLKLMNLLQNKTAVITGGSRGIGKGIVEVFAKQGANVAFTYNSSAEAAEALAEELSHLGVKVRAYKSNAASFDQSQELVDQVLEDFGSIDILINCMGNINNFPIISLKDNSLMKNYFNFKRVFRSNDDTTSLVFSRTNLSSKDSVTSLLLISVTLSKLWSDGS